MTSEINSPLGRRTIASPSAKVYTVPDALNDQRAEQEQPPVKNLDDFQAMRKETIAVKNKITPNARERIEILTGLGRLREDVDVEGVVFSMQSLKAGEMQEVVRATMAADVVSDRYYIGRNYVLAMAIRKVDGRDIEIILDNKSLSSKVEWLNEMEDSVVEYLHGKYLLMVQKKLVIETPEEMKEVIEDIKKS